MTLAKRYEQEKASGRLTTDVIWLNYGFPYGATEPNAKQVPFNELPDDLKKMRVTDSKWDTAFGAKFCWVEDGQLCVGSDANPLK